jgi:hypothetical protein
MKLASTAGGKFTDLIGAICMRRKMLVRLTATLAATTAIAFATPAIGAAAPQPLGPPNVPLVGIADGMGYSVKVAGNAVSYTATNVPPSGNFLGVPIPGACSSGVIDAVKAAPILGPPLVSLILSGAVPVAQLVVVLKKLMESNAVVASDLVRWADGKNVATHTFNNIPNGIYVVMTLCSVTAEKAGYGLTGAFVLGR